MRRRSGNSRYRVQISSAAWSADYPSPSSFIKLKLACDAFELGTDYNHNAGFYCDPSLDRQVDRAQRLQAWRPQRAAALWKRIERRLVNQAVWLPMVTPRTTDLVSRRVGTYQFHPVWGLLVDQLWGRHPERLVGDSASSPGPECSRSPAVAELQCGGPAHEAFKRSVADVAVAELPPHPKNCGRYAEGAG